MSDNLATTRLISSDGGARLFRRKYALQVLGGPDRGRTLTTAKESVSVGSAQWNDLVLDDASVSRHHLRIKIAPEGLVLTDLDSTNGTQVGSVQLRHAVVHGPVDLRLGDSLVRLTPLAEEEEVELLLADHFGSVIGSSAAMRELFRRLELVCRRDTTVLLEGETGTGKELIAREIHAQSNRSDKPFVIVDCGAIPHSLVESELFGHVAGSFTGATSHRPGPFEQADGGTVFLDEIGELSRDVQPKLLRVLESGEVKRIGETHHRQVDVRIVAATNRDLMREVNRGHFRADLFYRLAVVHLSVPPLREREADIEPLVRAFWPQLAGEQEPLPDSASITSLKRYSWPGNVRELRNVLQRLSIAAGPPALDAIADLAFERPASALSFEELDSLPFRDAKARLLAYFDRRYLTQLLERCDHNVTWAARESGIDRVHLYRLIKKYQLARHG